MTLRWILYREHGLWVAQCLEHDMAVQSPTLLELPRIMERSLIAQHVAARESGLPTWSFMPRAPLLFRELWEQGLALELQTNGRWQDDRGEPIPVPEIRVRLVDRPRLA